MVNNMNGDGYFSRQERSRFIADRFGGYINGSVLNLGGGGEKSLLQYVDIEKYIEVDIVGKPDLYFNLDSNYMIPFRDNSFDLVICSDVLEHLENLHRVFDEILRVSCRYVVISLPNSMSVFYRYLRGKKYLPHDDTRSGDFFGMYSKFYGLPLYKPLDRHRWFFSYADAKYFINNYQSSVGYDVVDEFSVGLNSLFPTAPFWSKVPLLRSDGFNNLFATAYWCLLKKRY